MRNYCLILLILFSSISAFSQEKKEKDLPIPPPKSFESNHNINLRDKSISYKAIAKETYFKNDKGEHVASFWSTSYLKNSVEDYSQRPVMFIFNGGPGYLVPTGSTAKVKSPIWKVAGNIR